MSFRYYQRRMAARRGGFTLVELMTVLLVLGILAALLVPRFIRARFKAQQTGCIESERNLATALESYAVDNNSFFPDNLTLLVSPGNGKSYIQIIPSCPSVPGSTYATGYEVAAGHLSYTISCPGVHYVQLPEITQGFPQYRSSGSMLQYNSNN